MATPRVEQVTEPGEPARIYFHDVEGCVWRIHDRAFGPPFAELYYSHTFPNVGDPRAGYRWFVQRDGSARLYKFGKRDARLADVATLTQQLTRTQYSSTSISADDALENY